MPADQNQAIGVNQNTSVYETISSIDEKLTPLVKKSRLVVPTSPWSDIKADGVRDLDGILHRNWNRFRGCATCGGFDWARFLTV